jgi:two-component system capsular synthesis sensor histidine kinase RcsC
MEEDHSNKSTPAHPRGRQRDANIAAPLNAASGRSASTTPHHSPAMRVLVVDDHPISRLLLQTQLKALGYDVDLAEEGSRALQQFAEARYDVVMTDLNMPGMDGCSLARNLRSQGVTVPILAFTATASDTERESCTAAGIDALFTKPLMIDAVGAMMRRLTGTAVAPNQLAAKPTYLTEGPLPSKLHALLQQSLRQSMQAITEALGKGDMQVVRDHLHSLRGSFAMIRETETADEVARMEQWVAAHDRKRLGMAMQAFAQHASSVLERRAPIFRDDDAGAT